jgi:hypothetical protein
VSWIGFLPQPCQPNASKVHISSAIVRIVAPLIAAAHFAGASALSISRIAFQDPSACFL